MTVLYLFCWCKEREFFPDLSLHGECFVERNISEDALETEKLLELNFLSNEHP